ncbi:hypothetical protein MUO83_06710 [Candidatus Bathyarchaeota archaeon]|nr:hypothetical protein [Candidatus Bathyarchaeota archaeon]
MKRKNSYNVVSLILILTIAASTLMYSPIETSQAQGNTMTFTTGETININSNVYIDFWSNVSMTFTSGIQIQFIEVFDGDGLIEPCDVIQVVFPPGFVMEPCSWWEVLDPLGNPTGYEFHIDQQYGPDEFHVDMVWPDVFWLPTGINIAEKKISVIEPCQYYVVHWPSGWYPAPCSWWEIIDPETGHPTGYEFHVDWTNESCEFHIDEVIPGPYILPFPWHQIEARKKIVQILPCDWYTILSGPVPEACSWWEIMYQGEPTGVEFHADQSIPTSQLFHVDIVSPDPSKIPPTYPTTARRKISTIEPCTWLKVDDLTSTPQPCTWWKITNPAIGDYEFHVDQSNQDGTFHVDQVYPATIHITPATDTVTAEKKITTIGSCDWFKVIDPASWLPQPCSWWRITSPQEWAGVIFHVDSTDQVSKFHIDDADTLPQGPTPPPWSVTAEEYTPPEPWYIKPPHPDYAPSGMPDFDQKQDRWGPGVDIYTWCGPVSVANSLWWLDSEYESLNFPQAVPPPIISDHFPLVTSYNPGVWDDHDQQNVDPLVRNLAFLMDTDGQRTGLTHQGTSYIDMETGISQYLQQQGVNPIGDCDGDGKVEPDDITIINNAMGSMPGAPNWNMAADVVINNLIDMMDLGTASSHIGQTGMFYEHTEEFADFYWIEAEIERCQDVELFLEFWQWIGSSWVKLYQDPSLEAGHFVTCAGVNSTNRELLISDPYWDTFEAGATQGRSPVAHPYPHPSSVHNDTRYVSHDEYIASLWMVPPPSPYGSKPVWELTGYLQAHGYDQTWHAFIRAAVATSPLGVHDVAVTNVTTSKTGCLPMETVGIGHNLTVDTTVENEGDFTETFNVQVKASNISHSITISIVAVNNLLVGEKRILSINWTVSGVLYDNYTISAVADTLPGETHVIDNTYTDGSVLVTMPGDVDGDLEGGRYDVDLFDAVKLLAGYGYRRGEPAYNPNCDIDNDGRVFLFDAVILLGNYGKKYP